MVMMQGKIQKLFHGYFGADNDLRVQSFNLLGLAGITAGLVVAVVSFLTGAVANGVINLVVSVLAFLLLRVAGKKLSYTFCCRAVVICVFMVAFPVLFFTAGGYKSGMPCFFVFAIIFTSIMLEGREQVASLIILFVLYTSACLIAFFYPDSVTPFETEADYFTDVIMSIIVVGILLLLVVMLHLRMYKIQALALAAQAEELAERNAELEQYVIRRGPLTIEITKDRALVDGRDADLTHKEYAILLLLIQNEERSLSGDAIYESVWGTKPVGENKTVRNHISKLRAKLGADDSDAFSITSGYGSGYRFILHEE
jgi:DNA-binding winged helix-turn-helix (wHTH) protein